MIRLHLLGFTPDLKGLVFSGRRGGKSGTYWVPVDEAFQKALTQLESAREDEEQEKRSAKRSPAKTSKAAGGDVASFFEEPAEADEAEPSPSLDAADTGEIPVPGSTPRVESKLSPREIQALLREGKSVPDVASRAGVEQSWVERFVGPVLEEKAGVIRRTRDAVQSRPRLGPSGLPIGLAVYRNLEDRKATTQTLDEIEDGWDARRLRARTWRVRLRFTHRGKKRSAEWEYRKDSGSIKPRNKLANDLGWWPPSESQQRDRSASRLVAPPGVDVEDQDPAPEGADSQAARTGARSKKAAKRSTRRASSTTGRRSSSKKKPSSKKPTRPKKAAAKTRKKPATKKTSGTRKKPATKKTAGTRKKPATKKKPASRKQSSAKKKAGGRKSSSKGSSSGRRSSPRRRN